MEKTTPSTLASATTTKQDTVTTQKPKNRRIMGRAARRRRRKLLDILQLETLCRSSSNTFLLSTTTTNNNKTLPVDRNIIYPTISSLRKLSQQDEMDLTRQLGYVPGNALTVASRASAVSVLKQSHTVASTSPPVVLKLYPLVLRNQHRGGKDGGRVVKCRKRLKRNQTDQQLIEPFPTLYWLTDPLLRILVSKLELEGFGTILQERLQQNQEATQSMVRAHREYGRERFQTLLEKDVVLLQERQWTSALDESRGVAGSGNFMVPKCLHAHTAHYLSGNTNNIIGQWVMEELQRRESRQQQQQTGTQSSCKPAK